MSLSGRMLEERYELQALLGRGGMGEVYEALDRHLDRQVAVKVMLEQFAGDELYLRRFRREAMSAASLNHPNIVHVYDFGVDQGIPYISMELVRGPDLREELLRAGTLSIAAALGVTQRVLAGLAYAHDRGILHRDIKPGNILLSAGRQVKLTDFGIARLVDETALTDSGLVLGTYRYLAPERAEGGFATYSSDLYSVGCVLFEMLAGDPPFDADTPVAVALQHIHGEIPSLRVRRPDVPAWLDEAVGRALAKEPENRFADAYEFEEALTGAPAARETAAVAGGSGDGPTRIGPPRPRPSEPQDREGRGPERHDVQPGAPEPTAVRRRDRAPQPTVNRPGEHRAPERGPRGSRSSSFLRRHPEGAAALGAFVILLVVGLAVVASALRAPEAQSVDSGGDTSTATSTLTSAPSTERSATTPTTSASPSGQPPTSADVPTTSPPPTSAPAAAEESPPTTLAGVSIGEPVEVTTFGATVQLPGGWEARGFQTASSLRTFRATGPSGATLRVDEDLAWTGGWEDLLPDAQRLEASLNDRYSGMKTISMERITHAGARALYWEFAYNTSGGRLHKIDLFFQKSADTPPAAVLVAWPENAPKEVEAEARAVLASLAFE